MADYTLFYAPHTCAIAPHIVLLEAGADHAIAKVDLRAKKLADGSDWLAINPKGYVPALRLADGDIITEGAVIIRYLADQFPQHHLAPPNGTIARVRTDEWVHFIATELHKGMSPLYATLAGEDYRKHLIEVKLPARWSTLAAGVRPFLGGETFSICDAYAFYVLWAWQRVHEQSLAAWPVLVEYYARLAERPSVAGALAAEGLRA